MLTIIAEFKSRDNASDAVRALETRGIPLENIGVIARGGGDVDSPEPTPDEAEAVADVGEELDVEGLPEPPVGLQALIIQDMGPHIAAGPWVTGEEEDPEGNLMRALTDMGVPDDEARYYCDAVGRGAVLLAIDAREEDEPLVRETLQPYV